MADVFVSYATKDRERVRPIVEAIERAGFSVWWDRQIAPGAGFDVEIQNALDKAQCVLVVWSENSVTSEWVITEASEGLERGILVPVSIDEVRPPLAFRRRQTIAVRHGKRDLEHVGEAVRGVIEGVAVEMPEVVSRPARRRAFWGFGGAAIGALVVYVGIAVTRSDTAPAAQIHADLGLEGWAEWRNTDNPAASMVIAPDSQTVVYVSRDESGASRLRVRRLDSLETFDIDGTLGAEQPFFSPDGRWIGYFQDRLMKRVRLKGGEPSIVTSLDQESWGASWGPEDRIVYSEGRSGLRAVAVDGGTPHELTTLDQSRGESSHRLPHHVRGTNVLLYTVNARRGMHEIWALDLSTGQKAFLVNGLAATYVATGHILYARGELEDRGSLWAAPFEPKTLSLTGSQISIQSGIAGREGAAFSTPFAGPIVYLPSQGETVHQLVLRDPGGAERVLVTGSRIVVPDFSKDGARVVFSGSLRAEQDTSVWIYQLETGALSRFGDGMAAIWGPGNESITYAIAGVGLLRQEFEARGGPERLVAHDGFIFPRQWLDGGRELLYNPVSPSRVADIKTLEPGAAETLIIGDGAMHPSVTRDEQWIAFCQYPAGVKVGRFPSVGAVTEVSASGCAPKWGPQDEWLYYEEIDKLWAVEVSFAGGEIALGEKRPIADLGGPGWPSHDTDSEGRIVFVRRSYTSPKPPVIVLNWGRSLDT